MNEFTYDLTTPVGKVRLLIPDKKPAKMRWTDLELTEFLVMEDAVSKRAAALALEVMASSKADCLSYIKTNAIEMDGTKPAKILLDRAKLLREQCAIIEAQIETEDEDEWEFTDLAEWN